MAKAIAIFTGGITEQRQVAIREDGVAFSRAQYRDHVYGYRWSKWAPYGETFGANSASALDQVSVGFATLRRAKANDCFINNRAMFDAHGKIKVRLP